ETTNTASDPSAPMATGTMNSSWPGGPAGSLEAGDWASAAAAASPTSSTPAAARRKSLLVMGTGTTSLWSGSTMGSGNPGGPQTRCVRKFHAVEPSPSRDLPRPKPQETGSPAPNPLGTPRRKRQLLPRPSAPHGNAGKG